MIKYYLLTLIFAALPLSACGSADRPNDNDKGGDIKIDWTAAADSSSSAFAKTFWSDAEHYFLYDSNGKTDFHYWPQAHALDVLVDAYVRTRSDEYKAFFDLWYEGVKQKNGDTFWNEYYDDMEWIALAMLRVYKATDDDKFKDAALQIWEYIKEGWNENAGGGITWKKGMEYSKNACSNGPACILAARLYQEFGNEDNKNWATRIYAWEKSTLFNSANGMIYDNINSNTGQIQKAWIFTYNQGTFVGAAVELYNIFGERAYLNDAIIAADYTISSLVDNSILKSEGTGDGGLFKGIFVRYFAELIGQNRLDAATKKRYLQFLRLNAETLWTQGAAKPAVWYSHDWRVKPIDVAGLTEQTSGCMLIEAAARLIDE